MHVSPSVMMVHSLDVAIQYQELEGSLSFSADGPVIVVTLELVQDVQVIQRLALVANQIRFEFHTAFPILYNGKIKCENNFMSHES